MQAIDVSAPKSNVRKGGLKKAADLLEAVMRTLFTVCGFIAEIGRAHV